MRAFWDLDTERFVTGDVVGRIPWSAVRRYGAERLEFDASMLDVLWGVVRAMDDAYLAWKREEYDRERRALEARRRAAAAKTRAAASVRPTGRSRGR